MFLLLWNESTADSEEHFFTSWGLRELLLPPMGVPRGGVVGVSASLIIRVLRLLAGLVDGASPSSSGELLLSTNGMVIMGG